MILTILLGIVGLGLMIFVHELGHFIAARLTGVHVEVFSLGWGTKLVGFTRGGTTYQVSWIPIGGYCKFKGEITVGLAGGRTEAEQRPEKGSFQSAAPWRRIVIAAFGSLFNLLFAVLAFTLIWWAGFRVFSADNRVVAATDYTLDSFSEPPPATVAGLRTGDRVLAIDGASIDKFQDLLEIVTISSGKVLRFTIQRGSENLTLSVGTMLDKSTGAGKIGVYSWVDPLIDTVAQGSASAIAGLRKGDRIIKAGEREIRNTIDLYQELASRPASLIVAYERQGAVERTPVVLMYDDQGAPNLGLAFLSPVYRSPRLGLPRAFAKSLEETWHTAALTFKGIGLLFKGINLRSAVAGPLRITYYIGTAATSGFQLGFGVGVVAFFRFLAFLSVVLFLMQLLPIPAMDGGQIIVFAAEAIRGKPAPPKILWRIQFVGFSLLIVLSVFVLFSDVLFLLGR